MLDKLNCDFTLFVNGKKALTEYKNSPGKYDMILMDCEMPVLNGYQTTIAIREWEKKQCLPRIIIIAVTAHAQKEFEEKSKLSGMDDYLTKPINIASLKKSLSKWIDSSCEE